MLTVELQLVFYLLWSEQNMNMEWKRAWISPATWKSVSDDNEIKTKNTRNKRRDRAVRVRVLVAACGVTVLTIFGVRVQQ